MTQAYNAVKHFVLQTISIVMVAAFFALPAAAADLDQDSVNELMKKKEEVLKTLKVPSNSYENEAQKKASDIMDKINSDDFQKQIQTKNEKLKSTIFKDHVSFATKTGASNDKKRASAAKLLSDERLYIFVSSSMPLQTLRNYAASIDKINDPNIFMIMRGFVGGVKDWKAMLDFSSRMLVKHSSCDTTKEQCDMYVSNLQIDPLLFRRYDVTLVPSVVYARGVSKIDAVMSEGLSDVARVSEFYSIQGDVSLEYFLETIRRETRSASIEAVLIALKRGWYDGD